jgi:leucyl/phenylalanyl-tRNA--protein transferase
MIHWLDADRIDFPPTWTALPEPNGLLAAGGDLSPDRLLAAYRRGIFPWFEEGQPILWWTPDPRAVLVPDELRVSRSLRKTIRNRGFLVSMDQAFRPVVEACAAPRGDAGTWITGGMMDAYTALYELGHAHSVEVWLGGRLAGGLYGVGLGSVFFGESMFSIERDASKVALVHLVARLRDMRCALVDCQLPSAHLENLGSRMVPRSRFEAMLDKHCRLSSKQVEWSHPQEPPRTPEPLSQIG